MTKSGYEKNLVNYHNTLAAMDRFKKAEGVGTYLTGKPIEDTGLILVGIDFDEITNPHEFANKINSYTSLSPSDNEVHILCLTEGPAFKGIKEPVEIYSRGRYLTWTGHRISQVDTINYVPREQLESLFDVKFQLPDLPKAKTTKLPKTKVKPKKTKIPEYIRLSTWKFTPHKELSEATEGNRNSTINTIGYKLGRRSEYLNYQYLYDSLLKVAESIGIEADEFAQAFNNGWNRGVDNPKVIYQPLPSSERLETDYLDCLNAEMRANELGVMADNNASIDCIERFESYGLKEEQPRMIYHGWIKGYDHNNDTFNSDRLDVSIAHAEIMLIRTIAYSQGDCYRGKCPDKIAYIFMQSALYDVNRHWAKTVKGGYYLYDLIDWCYQTDHKHLPHKIKEYLAHTGLETLADKESVKLKDELSKFTNSKVGSRDLAQSLENLGYQIKRARVGKKLVQKIFEKSR